MFTLYTFAERVTTPQPNREIGFPGRRCAKMIAIADSRLVLADRARCLASILKPKPVQGVRSDPRFVWRVSDFVNSLRRLWPKREPLNCRVGWRMTPACSPVGRRSLVRFCYNTSQ